MSAGRRAEGKVLFIFRRDLRLEDNTALLEARRTGEAIAPCFILDPRQVEDHPYRSRNALQFMLDSLLDLGRRLRQRSARLHLFYGEAERVVADLLERERISAVYANRDYTPFSLRRDSAIAAACRDRGVGFHQADDVLLHPPGSLVKQDGSPYTLFTPFYRQWTKRQPPLPRATRYGSFFAGRIAGARTEAIYSRLLPAGNPRIALQGGRTEGLKALRNLRRLANYERDRDYPARDVTTKLSAHNKFGTWSIREVHRAVRNSLGPQHELLRQLCWRDFLTHIAYHFPHVFGAPFRPRYGGLRWRDDERAFEAWCQGLTGFPIVDAGMRELNTTGFMHNRARLITASFLVKDLHIDWRWGERYFATKLVDYDPAVNNGNWQWVASTGADAQPYFRILNPWLQQKRFDPACEYVRRWVPELRDLPSQAIHSLASPDASPPAAYPRPIVDHAEESARARHAYARLR